MEPKSFNQQYQEDYSCEGNTHTHGFFVRVAAVFFACADKHCKVMEGQYVVDVDSGKYHHGHCDGTDGRA